ncbi:molecular chaperone TorD family protein [Adlercreutzia sp. R7]|uniref:Molecular chaperone TorD family protein n=1 Tax=Adlercreutzia wanghongyangiae TaxID=3111451 RepID=A0ABU6IK99_9ACTN|nr:molecular chaperone TorD family protein [Adlercreutzia sp. R7]
MTATDVKAEIASGDTVPEVWMARASLFELLSLGLLKPERIVAEALCSGEFSRAASETMAALGCGGDAAGVSDGLAAYEGKDADATYHEVLREHTRLFVGAREPLVTPFAGVRAAQERGQRGLLFVGPESMAVERFMRRCGVAKNLAAGQSNDPVDHVGTMCEFLMFLCLVAARAVEPADGAVVEPDDLDAFMADHFAPYAAWCSGRLRELSDVPFYRAMAAMLDAGIAVSR